MAETTKPGVTFTLFLEVDDPQELYRAALARMIADGVSKEDADDELRFWDEETLVVDVAACVRMLADPGSPFPGTSIIDSAASIDEEE